MSFSFSWYRRRHFFILSAAFSLWYCLSSHAHADNTPSSDISVSVFSTYPSDQLATSCNDISPLGACIEDGISPDLFINIIKEKGWFKTVMAFNEHYDYELLIAHMNTLSDKGRVVHFLEMTLLWRGMEINSTSVDIESHQDHDGKSSDSKEDIATRLLSRWYAKSDENHLFTTDFLYSALEASDYTRSLKVPQKLGDFTRFDTQLYPDPFKGAVTRYIHPTFEDALIDVTVYPLIAKASANRDTLLQQALHDDWKKASEVAHARGLNLSKDKPLTTFTANPRATGWRLAMKAESQTSDTIYATTYVFTQHDKIIKISTTFPTALSDPIARTLMETIEVPTPSPLMEQVRQLLN